MNNNKLIIAAAGSGKTTYIVNEALKIKNGRVLITTYTEANEAEICKIIIEKNKCIPENINVQTWFAFLLQHGVRPYQGCLFDKDINGLVLMNERSVPYIKESDTENHYFTNAQKIYSDKISKFVLKCNEKCNNAVIDRLSRIYTHILIDEVQDLAGYDLEFLKLLFASKINTLLVGDPRQGTYSTNNTLKNKKFQKSRIVYFFEDNSMQIERDKTSLIINHRCVGPICDFSNRLFPDLPKTTSGNKDLPEHGGIFLVRKNDVSHYLERFHPAQLRYDSRTPVNEDYFVRTFGDSKGLSFDRVVIYLTVPLIKWLEDNEFGLAPTSRSKFYVAITRARYSIGIVYDYNDNTNIEGVEKYNPARDLEAVVK
ncbi:MAG: UvrD-helicase domain-containing protein [Candidatus Omnitrophica bacterium]|jgi:DNA helicase-2/ATP-dependent DNA helicase PcrA|nr:UvrD-helicase domain-containing protein [Candidatus Omnitrophota bacterium]